MEWISVGRAPGHLNHQHLLLLQEERESARFGVIVDTLAIWVFSCMCWLQIWNYDFTLVALSLFKRTQHLLDQQWNHLKSGVCCTFGHCFFQSWDLWVFGTFTDWINVIFQLNESVCDGTAANTVFSFVDRERTALAHVTDPTEAALAQLYAHIQSLPESSKKKKLIKQFNKENGQGTPLQVNVRRKNHLRSKSLGDSIKVRHIMFLFSWNVMPCCWASGFLYFVAV
jgi:hypothetical protein